MSASESPMPYVSTAQVQQDDMDASSHDWYATSMPVNAPYDAHFGFVNPYVTPSVSSAGFSPLPEHAKSSGAATPMLSYTTSAAGDSGSYPSVSGAVPFSLDYSKPPTEPPRLAIPTHFDYSHLYNNNQRGFETTYTYGFTAPFDSLPPRPRSSPSVFSPVTPGGSRAFNWPSNTNALGISHASIDEAMFASSGHHQPAVLASSPPQSSAPTPEMHAPRPVRMYPPIAPHPSGMQLLASRTKRGLEEDSEMSDLKRRKSTASSTGHGTLQVQELGEEDRLLLKLKDEEALPWKDIAARFQTDVGKTYQIPALQMRLKRLRERLRVWTDADVKALRMAHDYWRESKFEIIAAKMLEFGASDKWTAKQRPEVGRNGPQRNALHDHPGRAPAGRLLHRKSRELLQLHALHAHALKAWTCHCA